jgi:CrcB protein
MNLALVAAVAVGGCIGAPARFLVDRAVSSRIESDLPLGTIVVNTTGSLLLGLMTGLAVRGGFPALLAAFVDVGVCGSYTTFSTLSYELLTLVEDGRLLEAAGSLFTSLALGIGVAAAGYAVGLWL